MVARQGVRVRRRVKRAEEAVVVEAFIFGGIGRGSRLEFDWFLVVMVV